MVWWPWGWTGPTVWWARRWSVRALWRRASMSATRWCAGRAGEPLGVARGAPDLGEGVGRTQSREPKGRASDVLRDGEYPMSDPVIAGLGGSPSGIGPVAGRGR